MSENREEILADFQACTGIEDVGEAILHLEESNWDLLSAVNRVVPTETQSFTRPVEPVEPDIMIVEDGNVGNAANLPAVPTEAAAAGMDVDMNSRTTAHQSDAAADGQNSAMLKFIVQYCDRVLCIELPESATISDLKIRLHRELKILPCRQQLSGWARMKQYENTPFSTLGLPRENSLFLTYRPSDSGFTADEAESSSRLSSEYLLNIQYENKTFNLRYPGTKTILEVKTDMYTLTNVNVRNQLWTGWPPNIDDQTMIGLAGISYPEHDLTMRRAAGSHNSERNQANSGGIVQIDSDDDEFEDASESFNMDDDYFTDNVQSKRTEPLIPENIEDEIVGSITFSEQFTARYGPVHPAFYQGTLEEALKEACNKPAKDRKILAIYLHHDASVLTNVFCTQLLGYESVMQMFERHFILWGWDVTFESNRARLQNSVSEVLGRVAATSLRGVPVDRLPAIVLVMRVRSSTDIYSVIHGNVGVNELLSSLIEVTEVFGEHQKVEAKEEQERAERELVKWEQDQAYRESLEADRAKEEAKRMLEESELAARRQAETERAEEEAKKEAHRKQIEAGLPPEPPSEQGDQITKIRFRLPGGDHLERRFHTNTSLKVLLDYLTVEGFPLEEYKVISSWPRRDLTAVDPNSTLLDLKLCPQETVILEER